MKYKKNRLKNILAAFLCALCLCMPGLSVSAAGEAYRIRDDFVLSRELIARVIECTAPDASYTARQALAALILNRTEDPRFPDDVRSVIYERGVFECVDRVDFERVRPSDLSMKAARDALLGFDVSGGALYFKRGTLSESDGACLYHSGFLFYIEK